MATNTRNDPMSAYGPYKWWSTSQNKAKQEKKQKQAASYKPYDYWAYAADKKRFSNVKRVPKYTMDEALTLSRNNYTSLFRAGSRETVGLVGTPWQQTAALYRLRRGYTVPNLIYSPESQKQALDMAAAKPIVFGGALYNTINELNTKFKTKYGEQGEKYIAQYGNLPSADSKYGILYNLNNPKIRRDAVMSNYQNLLAEQARNLAKQYLNPNTGDATQDAVLSAKAMELMAIGEEYRSKKGSWSDKRISELSSALAITPDRSKWSPEIQKAIGAKAPTEGSYGTTAVAAMATGPFGALFGSTDSGAKVAQQALEKMEAATNASLLSPEVITSEDNPFDIAGKLFGNTAKGLARMAVGMPVGVAAVVNSLAETGENVAKGQFKTNENTWNGIDTTMLNAIKDDYVKRYKTPFDGGITSLSSWKKFGQALAEDPTMPVLDVLSVVPVVGWVAKGAGTVAIAGRVGKFGTFGDLTDTAQAKYRAAEGITEKEAVVVGPETQRVAEARAAIDEINAARANMSARRYNRLARRALAGQKDAFDVLKHHRNLGLILPKGENSLLIRAGAKFEPKTVVLNKPRREVKLADGQVEVTRRLPASPVARAGSYGLTWLQRTIEAKTAPDIKLGEQVTKPTRTQRVAEVLVDMPGIGYRWQYSRAQKAVLTADMHDALNELSSLSKALINTATKADLSIDQERAVMAMIAGGTGDIPSNHPALQKATLEAKRDDVKDKLEAEDLADEYRESLLNDLKVAEARIEALGDVDAFETTLAALRERLTNPDRRTGDRTLDTMADLVNQGRYLYERKNRIVTQETDVVTLAYLQQLYAEAITALRISGDQLFGPKGELFGLEDRVLKMGGGTPFNEARFGGDESWRNIRNDNGENPYDLVEDADERKFLLAEYTRAMDALDEMGTFRGDEGTSLSNGNPILVAAENAGKYGRNGDFIAFHRLHLDGVIEDGKVKRGNLLNENDVFYLPKEFFLNPTKKLDKKDAADLVEVGALNAMAEYFPNARFYSDKVTESGLGGEAQNFTDIGNEGIVARNALKQHTLGLYAASQLYFAKNRYDRDIGDLLAANAELIPLSQAKASKGAFNVLSYVRLFTDRTAAEQFARDRGVLAEFTDGMNNLDEVPLLEEASPFDLETGFGRITRNGQEFYAIRGDIRDWSVVLQREEATRLKNYSEYQRVLYDNLESIPDSNGTYVLAVPTRVDRMVKRMVREGNDYTDGILNAPLVKGPTNAFKRLVLNLNPKFIGTNVIGGLAMMMMYNPLIAAKILTRALQNAARESGTAAWYNIVRDGNVLEYHLAYELDKNIYRQELGPRAREGIGMAGMASKYGWNGGYTTVAAFEKFVRKAVAKDFLEGDEVFRAFMDGPEVDNYIRRGVDFQGNPADDITRFEAAADLLLDPQSPYYNGLLKSRMRYTTNTVSGNYHSFGPTEQLMRNLLMPFYAWQRHSLAFTWRLPIDKPITAAAIGNLGGYGYNVALSAGLPEWMYQTVPMPEFMKDALGLEGEDYRIDLGAISPFGTTADMTLAAYSLFSGQKTGASLLNFTNPYVNEVVKTTTGIDPFTGRPVYDNKGLIRNLTDSASKLPGIAIPKGVIYDALVRGYEDDALANKYRAIDNAEDIIKNFEPGDRFSDWELSIPSERTMVASASWNDEATKSFFPIKIYEPNLVRMSELDELAQKEAAAAGLLNGEQSKFEKDEATKIVDRIVKWKRKRDFVLGVWLPSAEAQGVDANTISFVLAKLEDEKPKTSKDVSFDRILQVLGG